MLSHEALRQAARTVPAVLVDSAQLMDLLDAAERAPKPKAPRAPRQANPDDEKCARWLYTALLGTAPRAKQPNFTTWADEVRLMRERDGRAHREMCELFQWAHTDSFWRQNILSPTKLREHWDKLTIKRDAAAAPKPAAGGAWWATDATIIAKGVELGLTSRPGESMPSFKARLQAAIDNGGVAPTQPGHIRSVGPAANMPEQRGTKPAGLDLKAILRGARPDPDAQAA